MCFNSRGQEQHIRYEHIYLPEPSSQSEVDYAEIKRPRLEMGPESLLRASAHRPTLPLGPAEDMAKVSDLWRRWTCWKSERDTVTWLLLRLHQTLTEIEENHILWTKVTADWNSPSCMSWYLTCLGTALLPLTTKKGGHFLLLIHFYRENPTILHFYMHFIERIIL